MDLPEILDQIKALQNQKLQEVTIAGKDAVDHRINDLLIQAGDLRAITIDPTFQPGRGGNTESTVVARNQYIRGLKDTIKSPEFKQTGISRK